MPKIRTVAAARAWRAAKEAERAALADAGAVLNDENAALKTQVDEAVETMRTIANAFSVSLWKVLPQGIKQHFEKYRS